MKNWRLEIGGAPIEAQGGARATLKLSVPESVPPP